MQILAQSNSQLKSTRHSDPESEVAFGAETRESRITLSYAFGDNSRRCSKPASRGKSTEMSDGAAAPRHSVLLKHSRSDRSPWTFSREEV